jgi:hypothetical protein
MSDGRAFSLVRLKWRVLSPPWKYPQTAAFGATGFREAEGPGDLFSVYVELLEGRPGPGVEQNVRVFALVPGMEPRLPQPGEGFAVTAGNEMVAAGVVIERGVGEPGNPA